MADAIADVPISIRFDEAQLKGLTDLLGGVPKALPRIMSQAINRAVTSFRSRVTHAAAKDLLVPLKEVKLRVRMQYAKPEHLTAHAYVVDKGFSLIHWKPFQQKRGRMGAYPGVILMRGSHSHIPGAFIAVLQKAQRNAAGEVTRAESRAGVYKRKGRARFPVFALRTAGVIRSIKHAGGWDAEYAKIMNDLEKRLKYETEKVLSGEKWTGVESSLNETWDEWRSRMGAQEFR